MLAAIYARKSTEQNGMSDEEKSVTRQIAHARAYAARKGWTVSDEHVYVDDGISGAEFAKRPGFLRLMNALKPRPPFHILVMSEESRLGRESIEVAYALKQLAQAGVRVFLYLTDHERTIDSPTAKLLMSVSAFTDEIERERARQRTHDSLLRKAQAGHVTGGVVFGYRNEDVFADTPGADGRPRRLHVKRVIDPTQAAVVCRIFALCAEGYGFKRIAKLLNDERVPSPAPRRSGRPRAWAPSSVREVLHRQLYRGELVWNQVRKRDQWGVKRYVPRPEAEWIRVRLPELQIVADELWNVAHARLTRSRATYLRATQGQRWGRPASGVVSKHLLTGMAECAGCHGNLTVTSRDFKHHRRHFYGCASYHARGRAVCTNGLEVSLANANTAVVTALRRDVFQQGIVEDALRKTLAELRPGDDARDAQRVALADELARIEHELERLAAAVAAGGDVPALVTAIREREQQRRDLAAQLAALEGEPRLSRMDVRRIEQEARERLRGWRALLARHPDDSRTLVDAALAGRRLIFTPRPENRVYEVAARWSVGSLLSRLILAKGMVTPAGSVTFGNVESCFLVRCA